MTQLVELPNRGASGGYNNDATYDYLAYLFADLAKVFSHLSIQATTHTEAQTSIQHSSPT